MAVVASSADIVQQLADKDPAVKVAGLCALKDDSQLESQAGTVARLLADPDWGVRRAAVEVFSTLGSRGASQADTVGRHLADKHAGVAAAAASAIACIGAGGASQASALEAMLARREEDATTCMLAAAGVTQRAVPQLRKPACAAAAALAALGAAGGKSAQKVAECLKDPDSEIRTAAVNALGKMGREGSRYEAQITECLNDSAPYVVAAACDALGELAASTGSNDAAASEVAELLTSNHVWVRAAAARALGRMADETAHHLEALVKLLLDRAPSVKVEAMLAISKCGEMGQMYAVQVARHAFDQSPWVRCSVCEALAAMGARGACFVEEIAPLLDDEHYEVSDAAARAMHAFETATLAKAVEVEAPKAIMETPAAGTSSRTTLPVALLFPGQGSQYLGMMTDAQHLPAVKDMLAQAKAALGFDVLELCLKGPEDKLEQTKFCQPVMYIGGLAGVEMLRKDKPQLIDQVRGVAGLSLGEYTALTFAGVMDFATGLKLVKLRAEAMQEAAEASAQLMASIAGLEQPVLDKLCAESCGPGETCKVANFLFPRGFSCAGSKAAIEKLVSKASSTDGCLQAKTLKTSGAFHTELMRPAQERLLEALKEAEPNMKPPICDVYVNVSAKKIAAGTPASEFVPLLAEQLCSCVLWEPSMKAMIGDGIEEFYECGPMKQLKAMMKRINDKAWKSTTNVSV